MNSNKDARDRFLNHFSQNTRKIIESYVDTPEGRSRLALSLIKPLKLARDYLKSSSKPWNNIDYPMESRLQDYHLLIAIIPPDEQNLPPFSELKTLASELQHAIDERKTPMTPKVKPQIHCEVIPPITRQ